MSVCAPRRHGYYDENGRWQRTKFCFAPCRDRCTCRPPFGRYYSAKHDKSKADTSGSVESLLP